MGGSAVGEGGRGVRVGGSAVGVGGLLRFVTALQARPPKISNVTSNKMD